MPLFIDSILIIVGENMDQFEVNASKDEVFKAIKSACEKSKNLEKVEDNPNIYFIDVTSEFSSWSGTKHAQFKLSDSKNGTQVDLKAYGEDNQKYARDIYLEAIKDLGLDYNEYEKSLNDYFKFEGNLKKAGRFAGEGILKIIIGILCLLFVLVAYACGGLIGDFIKSLL